MCGMRHCAEPPRGTPGGGAAGLALTGLHDLPATAADPVGVITALRGTGP
jgi:hypothetical protein